MPPVLAGGLASRGHDVRVLTGFPNFPEGRLYDGYRITWRKDCVVSGIPVRRVALYPDHSRSVKGRLANYGSFALTGSVCSGGWFKDTESIWVYSWPSVVLPLWVMKARYRPQIVLHVMDIWPETLFASGFGGALERHRVLKHGLDRLIAATYGVADKVVCISRSQIELLAERGVPRDKLHYGPIWADEDVFHPAERDDALAAELGVSDKTVLMYAGALGEAQGLETLIGVCARLTGEPSFHCLVAGYGLAETRLRAAAQARGLKNITFLGRWPVQDMTRLMSVGDVHLVSLSPDPLAAIAIPSKVPATLACAKPLIVAARGETATVVERSGAGWITRPGAVDELEAAVRSALLAGRDALQQIGLRARTFYESEFSVDIGVSRVEQLLTGQERQERDAA